MRDLVSAIATASQVLANSDFGVPLTVDPTRGIAMVQLLLLAIQSHGFPRHERIVLAEAMLTAALYEQEVGLDHFDGEELIQRLTNAFVMGGADRRSAM